MELHLVIGLLDMGSELEDKSDSDDTVVQDKKNSKKKDSNSASDNKTKNNFDLTDEQFLEP